MARDRKLAALIVVGVVTTAALGFLGNVITSTPAYIAWIARQRGHLLRDLIIAFAVLVTAAVVVALWQSRMGGASEDGSSDQGPIDEVFRRKLLARVLHDRVRPRFHQGLRKAVRIGTSLTEIPAAVRPRLRLYTEIESGPLESRELDESIATIFEQMAGGRLLILGDPGTGKTNLLLELAESLILKAEGDPSHPIPIVFSLPRWTLDKRLRKLDEWLADDLSREYGVSRATAERLLKRNLLVPLLDSLDEVAEHRRSDCVKAINTFQMERDLCLMAVCCRSKEYEGASRLQLETAVRVERLSRTAVERELTKPYMEAVALALQEDPQLWEIVDTPLWLHVLFGAAKVKPGLSGESADPRNRLYARYVEYALNRDPEGAARKRTGRKLILHWLGWLAAAMRRRGQSQFSFEDLTLAWVQADNTDRPKRLQVILAYLFPYCAAVGLIFSFRRTLFGGGHWWLGLGPLLASSFGVIDVLFGDAERPAEAVALDWRLGRKDFLENIAIASIAGLVLFGASSIAHFTLPRRDAVFVFVLTLLGLFVFDFVQIRQLSGRSAPNAGTVLSLRFFLALQSAAVVVLVVNSFVPVEYFYIDKASGMFGILLMATSMTLGGSFCLQNFTTRILLSAGRRMPWKAVRFFEEAAARLFLIQHGGSFEFVHITFRDYMAEVHGPDGRVSPELTVPVARPTTSPCP